MKCGKEKKESQCNAFLFKTDYRYNYLIYEAMEKGNIKRIRSFIKMGRLIPLNL